MNCQNKVADEWIPQANSIVVRDYQLADAPKLAAIFYQTVQRINALDYSQEQIDVFAPDYTQKPEHWLMQWAQEPPIVALIDGEPVGFAELDAFGKINCFYVHYDYQGKGVGKKLLYRLHELAVARGIDDLSVDVSVTARKFFQNFGFTVQRVNVISKNGVQFRNTRMVKNITKASLPKRNLEITTERLVLRTPKFGDAYHLHEAIIESSAALSRWMTWGIDQSLETTEEFIADGIRSWQATRQADFPLIVEYRETGEIIGASGFNDFSDPEIPFFDLGYWLKTSYTGKGLATELTLALAAYAFDSLGATRVQLRVQHENLKSRAVAERCGFRHEATIRNSMRDCLTNELSDAILYSCLGKELLNFTVPTS